MSCIELRLNLPDVLILFFSLSASPSGPILACEQGVEVIASPASGKALIASYRIIRLLSTQFSVLWIFIMLVILTTAFLC